MILRRVYQMGKHVGEEAGGVRTDADGMTYRAVSILRRVFMSHRVAWLLHYGVWPTMRLDHRDGDGLNNRIDNLREVTNQQNGMNSKMSSRNSSGVVGVRWHPLANKWQARIKVFGCEEHLGLLRVLKMQFPQENMPNPSTDSANVTERRQTWEHQPKAIEFLGSHRFSMLSATMGAGKSFITVQNMRQVATIGTKRSLILCPAAVLSVWRREFFKHSPENST